MAKWLWITIILAISIPTGLAIWAIKNPNIGEIIKLSVDFISKLALPTILAIWAVYSENRKSEEQKEQLKEQRRIEEQQLKEQRRREDFAMIKEYIDNKMVPFAEEFHKRPFNQKTSHADMVKFTNLWQGLYHLALDTEYEERAKKFNEAIHKEFEKFIQYGNQFSLPQETRDSNKATVAFEVCIKTLYYAYPIIKNEGAFNWHYDTLTLSYEEVMKKYFPQESPDA